MAQRSLTTSTHHTASHLRVPQSRVWRTLHNDGLYPCQHQPVHLHPGDDAQWLQFCHWLSHNRELLPYILFTDEATFTLNSINNTHNCHNWATVKTNFETWFSVNVWCGNINNTLIRPVVVEDRMTGGSYLHFLQNDLPEQLEDVPLDTRCHLYLQHDGAPIHYTRMVIQYMPFFQFQNQAIATIHDPPHLLKCIRKLFVKYDVHFESEGVDSQLPVIAKWEHIEKLYKHFLIRIRWHSPGPCYSVCHESELGCSSHESDSQGHIYARVTGARAQGGILKKNRD